MYLKLVTEDKIIRISDCLIENLNTWYICIYLFSYTKSLKRLFLLVIQQNKSVVYIIQRNICVECTCHDQSIEINES